MMRGRHMARLKHLALGAGEPFTLGHIMTAWHRQYGMAELPTKAQVASGLKELKNQGLVVIVGRDDRHRQLWKPVRD